MNFQTLNEIIRKEPVCLWVGSGFSLAAGMPSVKELKNILYNSLSEQEKELVQLDKDLRTFAQQFQTLKGRPTLVSLIQERIRKAPLTTHDHDLLARVAHFRSIVTTNYDQLIENACTRKTAVILSSSDIATSRLARRKVYKIHGDIDRPESIVITSDDYAKQYNRVFKDPFWASFIDQISSHHVIFMGYGYEDENVWSDFIHIYQQLGENGNRRFFISPDLDPIKALRLNELNIEYLPATGEQFLYCLIEDIKRNLKDDLANGEVDTQVAQDFITGFDLNAVFNASKDGTELVSISKAKGVTEQKVSFDIIDPDVVAALVKFQSGYEIKKLQITAEQLKAFDLLVEGFTLLDRRNLAHFDLQHAPKSTGFCTITFKKQRFALNGIKYELYNSIPGKTLLALVVNDYRFDVTIIKEPNGSNTINFNTAEPDFAIAAEKRHQFFKAAHLLFSGEKMTVRLKKGLEFMHQLKPQKMASQFEEQRQLYSSILFIQERLNVTFPPLPAGGIEIEDLRKIKIITSLIKTGYYCVREPEGITVKQMPDNKALFEELKAVSTKDTYTFLVTKKPKDVELLGCTIYLGEEQVALKEPDLTQSDYETLTIHLVPSDGLITYFYKRFGHMEPNNATTIWDGENIPKS